MELVEIITNIVDECVHLKNKYVSEKDLTVDWVCIFSHTEDQYHHLNQEASLIGEIIETSPSGLVYKLTQSIVTSAGVPKILKVRFPDPTKPEKGDADFNTDYKNFKNKYLDNSRFTLIVREKFEMLELKDTDFDVRVYFSNIPPSEIRGVK